MLGHEVPSTMLHDDSQLQDIVELEPSNTYHRPSGYASLKLVIDVVIRWRWLYLE